MLRKFFAQGIDLRICSTMRCWWLENREVVLEYPAHPIHSLLHMQGDQRKSATKKKGQRTYIVRRTIMGSKGTGKPRQIIAAKHTGTQPGS